MVTVDHVASRIIDGARIPELVAHHPALELCNTRAGWGTAAPKEYLVDCHALNVWARENAFLSTTEYRLLERLANDDPRRARATVVAAHRVRDLLYGVLTGPSDPSAYEQFRKLVIAASHRSRYVELTDGTIRLDVPTALTAPVDRAVLAAHRLLETTGVETVHRCPGAGCGWLFFDPSARRRWCIMAVCGNRAKAQRFAQRQRA